MIAASLLTRNDMLPLIKKPLETALSNEVVGSGTNNREGFVQDSLGAQVPPAKMGLRAESP